MNSIALHNRLAGVLVGTAVGDALGLPAEGMSAPRICRRWKGEWKHRFILGRGMISDDTEHTFFVAQALLEFPDDVGKFQRCLAWKFRWWLLGIPAGIGFATLRSIGKLWLGFRPGRNAVFSAGNGPAMRSAIIGAYFADDPEKLRAFVKASTQLTHSDPKAENAALSVAQLAAWCIAGSGNQFTAIEQVSNQSNDQEWRRILAKATQLAQEQKDTKDFADWLGQKEGVSGYSYHSVPVAIYSWLRHGDDIGAALTSVLDCGGDTDTTGAIVGALMGAALGVSQVPDRFRRGLVDWPRSLSLLENVGQRLATQKLQGKAIGPVSYFWPAIPLRNALFIITVLIHGFRRLLPPY